MTTEDKIYISARQTAKTETRMIYKDLKNKYPLAPVVATTEIRGQAKDHIIYDDHNYMPPEPIIEAARLLENYFKTQGVDKWELMGICSRNYAWELEKLKIWQEKADTILRDSKNLILAVTDRFNSLLS